MQKCFVASFTFYFIFLFNQWSHLRELNSCRSSLDRERETCTILPSTVRFRLYLPRNFLMIAPKQSQAAGAFLLLSLAQTGLRVERFIRIMLKLEGLPFLYTNYFKLTFSVDIKTYNSNNKRGMFSPSFFFLLVGEDWEFLPETYFPWRDFILQTIYNVWTSL